ncbi:inositol-trisphosphate 3-kinase homolog [Hetaerina americana]|uniref:inositol-trisphosphate 3-kinase homolog n=1 Tax=Hetaerina americana TaxID=62018 RepID=UPI003A7F33BE
MDSSVTQFPPPSYSTSYRLRTAWKEVLSQRLNSDQKRSGNDILTELQEYASSDSLPYGPKCDPTSCPRTEEQSANHDDLEDNVFLQFLALNALDLTAPASDVLLRLACARRHHPWFQLSGHTGFLAPAGPGTIWKRGGDSSERQVYEKIYGLTESGKARRWLWRREGELGGGEEYSEAEEEPARDVLPRFFREVTYKGEKFLELQDLLFGFADPYVMDVKIGTRTFLEKEASADISSPPRHDLYLKMVKVDPYAPTEEEHGIQMVTKLRYMQFREEQSSSSSLGFRIEAIRLRGLEVIGDLKKLKSREDVSKTLRVFFTPGGTLVQNQLLNRLREIRSKFEQSPFFKTHEVVGSSVLLLYDENGSSSGGDSSSQNEHCNAGAWLIDFAKTRPLPKGISINHRNPWRLGNHEEGFLFGMDALIQMIGELDLSVPDKDCLGKGGGRGGSPKTV